MTYLIYSISSCLIADKIKFKFFTIVIIIFNISNPKLPAFPLSDSVVAYVGNYNISLSDFAERYSDYLFATGTEDKNIVREAILNNMINEILLHKFDQNDKIYSNTDYVDELEWSRKQTILSFLKDREIYAKILVTEDELRETFLRVNEQIAARHIFTTREEEANELYELLQSGFDFNTLAYKVFTDSVLMNNGGYLGYFTWGDMDPAFEEMAYSLKIGEISKPVKTAYGYSIIKVDDRVVHPLLTEYEFQKKKSSLERTLRIRKKRPYELEYINRIFDRNKILFNEESLNRIFSKIQINSDDDIESNSDYDQSVCVEYDGQKYEEMTIKYKLSHVPYYHKSKIDNIKKLKVVIEGLLIQERLYNLAIEKGYDREPLVLGTYEKLQNNIFLKYKMNEIMEGSNLTDSLVRSYYKENIQYFSTPNEINIQEIIVNKKELADTLLKRLTKGENFGELAKQYSLREWSAVNSGIIGYSPVSNFGILQEKFWDTEPGEVLGPERIGGNYGLFKILGKIDSNPIDFELVKNNVIKAAKYEYKTQLVKEYIDKIRERVKIKVNHQLLNADQIVGL